MLLDSVRKLLGRHQPPAGVPFPAVELPPPVSRTPPESAENDDPVWPSSRIAVAEALWGEGFLFAGGRAEALRLALQEDRQGGVDAQGRLLAFRRWQGGRVLRILRHRPSSCCAVLSARRPVLNILESRP